MAQEITGHYIIVDGTRIYYEECGKGIPLFCIHSAGCCSLEFKEFLPVMAEKGFRVVVPDLPGHGKSYPVNWQPIRKMHTYAEFVWKIAKAVCGREKPIVTGISIGGNMTIDLACHHSEEMRAAIAQEGAGVTQTYVDVSNWEQSHAFPSWQNAINDMAIPASSHPSCPEIRVIENIWNHRFTSQIIGCADIQCWIGQDCEDKLKDVKCPILIIKGAADYYVPESIVDATVAKIPNGLGEKLVIENVGHFPSAEQPEQLGEVFMDFLKRSKVLK